MSTEEKEVQMVSRAFYPSFEDIGNKDSAVFHDIESEGMYSPDQVYLEVINSEDVVKKCGDVLILPMIGTASFIKHKHTYSIPTKPFSVTEEVYYLDSVNWRE